MTRKSPDIPSCIPLDLSFSGISPTLMADIPFPPQSRGSFSSSPVFKYIMVSSYNVASI